MPELPDVEGYRKYFLRHARGKTVRGLHAERDIVRNSSPQALGRYLVGRRFGSPLRVGKWLACPAGDKSLLLHFGMTGKFVWSGEREGHPHDRMELGFSDGYLIYRNQRKLGGVWLAVRGEERDITGPLGPDALDLSEERFRERLEGRRGSVKSALMKQKVVAGLGNLTVDEALWHARIDPHRSVDDLSEEDLHRLHLKVQKVLRDSVPHGLVPSKRTWLTGARGHREPRCPRCGRGLVHAPIAGRTAYWCPACQS